MQRSAFGQFRHSWDLEPAHLYYKFTYPGQFFGPKFSGNTDCATSTHCYGVGGKSPPFEGSAKISSFIRRPLITLCKVWISLYGSLCA